MSYLAESRALGSPPQGTPKPDYTLGDYNPANFIIFKPSDWEQGHKVSVKINAKGYDPGILLYLKLVTINHESSSYQVFHSFYEKMKSEFPISDKTKKLFLSLAESISQALNVTSCCLWVDQHGRPLAMGSKGARPTCAL
jgi:hypothetical protein